MADITKSPGHDWTVFYMEESEDPAVEYLESVEVFGFMTAEEAISEARSSLTALGEDCPPIVAVVRLDISSHRLG